MKRKPFKRKGRKIARKPRKTKKAIWAEYGLERPAKPRYSGLRGIVWHLLSIYVRIRDLKAYGPVCVNCGQVKEEFHGGHFIATGDCGWDGMALDEMNVHSECSACNFRDKAKLKYARNLDLRYGPGTAQKLRDRYYEYKMPGVVHKNWSQEVYRAKIAELQQKISTLKD